MHLDRRYMSMQFFMNTINRSSSDVGHGAINDLRNLSAFIAFALLFNEAIIIHFIDIGNLPRLATV